jgi:hypothetical protein
VRFHKIRLGGVRFRPAILIFKLGAVMLNHLTTENIKTISELSKLLHQTLDRAVGTELETYINRLSNDAKHELAALFLLGKEGGNFDIHVQRVSGGVGALHKSLRAKSRLPLFLSQGAAKLGIDLSATEEPIDPDEAEPSEETEDAAAA